MKIEIAITLIICGTILIAVPPASDYLQRDQVAKVMIEKPEATSVMVGEAMSEEYRLGCWFTGAAMIGVAVIASLRAGRRQHAGHGEPAATAYAPGPEA
jgi:hypothetical protein